MMTTTYKPPSPILREFIDTCRNEDGPTVKKGSKRGNSLRKYHYKRKSAPKPVTESREDWEEGEEVSINPRLVNGGKNGVVYSVSNGFAVVKLDNGKKVSVHLTDLRDPVETDED